MSSSAFGRLNDVFSGPGAAQRFRHRLLYLYLLLIFVLVLAPVAMILPIAFVADFQILFREQYINGITNSFILGFTVAILATVLSTAAARYYRQVKNKNAYILFMSLPLFIPADTHAVAVAATARELGIGLGFWTLVGAHLTYVFPYAFLMVLATMAGLPKSLLAAAQDLGATGFRAFRDVELPLVADGVISAFLVSFLLSFNEAPRALILGGAGFETLSSLVLAYYDSIGITIALYGINVVMTLFAIVVVVGILTLVLLKSRQRAAAAAN
ncbi:MAG: ABC transporter permease [Halobacteriota archaeon]|uniref:ABC transporter permease n=1 Tax=Natronomonas sp. TaxID=2184060 RepID=UPI0039754AB0